MGHRTDNTLPGWLELFASAGTLICCALPIMMVAPGFGSVVVTLTSHFPLLVTLSANDGWMFAISALLLGLASWTIWGRQVHCPTESLALQHVVTMHD